MSMRDHPRAERVILIFVDGLGLGVPDAEVNPLRHPDLTLLANYRSSTWSPPPAGGPPPSMPAVLRDAPLPWGGAVIATDASLGLPGLPQSATGQTTLLTGVNAGSAIGLHLFGFPSAALRQILMRSSILKQVTDAGGTANFINAFRPRFFELGEEVWKRRLSATTWSCRAADLPFRTLEDLLRERAVYQDITHDSMRARGFAVDARAPERAGEILATMAREFDCTLFEFFQTDRAGHAQDRDKAERELGKLEAFVGSVLASTDLDRTTVILTSDHGNVEDLSVKTHTFNPVPTLVFGPGAGVITPRLTRLDLFVPLIMRLLERPRPDSAEHGVPGSC